MRVFFNDNTFVLGKFNEEKQIYKADHYNYASNYNYTVAPH